MDRIRLTIADNDEDYVKSLENYIFVNYPQRFELCTFTDACNEQKLKQCGGDILLVGSRFDGLSPYISNFGSVATLTEGQEKRDAICIDKYQHAEKIMSDILNIINDQDGLNYKKRVVGQKHMFTAAVISPGGGCGKSSVASGCSKLLSERGYKTFYLNMERIPSTSLYFKGTSGQNFSNVIYYLKEGRENIASRIEAARCADPDSGVHYFLPADNILEMNELLPADVESLIAGFRELACYDVLFVDIDDLNEASISILREADAFILVGTPDASSWYKAGIMLEQIKTVTKKCSTNIFDKLLFVFNKYNESAPEPSVHGIGGDKIYDLISQKIRNKFYIKYCKELYESKDASVLANPGPAFTAALGQIADELLSRKAVKQSD